MNSWVWWPSTIVKTILFTEKTPDKGEIDRMMNDPDGIVKFGDNLT